MHVSLAASWEQVTGQGDMRVGAQSFVLGDLDASLIKDVQTADRLCRPGKALGELAWVQMA